jgi:hypothetical protein
LERIADGLGMPDEARMTLGLAPAQVAGDGPGDRGRCTCGSAGEKGECSMHRRHFLAGAGSAAAGSAGGSAALVDPALLAEVVRRRTSSNVDDLTLDDLELTVDHLMQQVPIRSHHELFPLAARNWAVSEQLLDGWQHGGQRRRLIGLAGQLSYYVGRLHLSAGRYPQSWQLATLTQQYATETGDHVLRHSAAGLQHSVAFYNGKHQRSVDVLERAESCATDYTRARALSKVARAHSALGDRDATLTALRGMRAAVLDLPRRAGDDPFTEASALLSTTGCLQRLGDGAEAVAVGRQTVQAFDAGHWSSREEHTQAQVALALALTTGPDPEPDEAAALGNAVIASPQPLTGNVIKRLAELRTALRPWGRTPEVAVFTDQVGHQERLDRGGPDRARRGRATPDRA